ncbi:septal ring lytic transglycosylase RlpA family protein [Psychrosphaera sp. 1_MG-2023]|uniref:septal ring lytic transglycosylase RlpA family protein n=1 Tax=Psychrosphaera sp. 1_MG-2023 TaxID=3062643 RepID=UPI0026E23371|nr:septal ring lytic transglycosylase RlpA family protein [Psychrosphaera sp. 1_MG-2023]MDO6720500.1 septal ring lytic transglycosylase RlpA family protein [Psychrosphaera sp. 1_MG-2023]
MKFVFIFVALLLASCTSGRYDHKHDSAPVRPPTAMELEDAKVVHEPVGRGNNPYIVFGKKYKPMRDRKPYSQQGIASWYGKKFHGHLTSNGEVYDMYAMSAAHKTLPLPSYVKVTNLSNNKTVVVRVNDRGPFHESRIIDLSYSAAVKIGVFDTGTANVKIETILPPPLKPKKPTVALESSQYQIRVSGFQSRDEVRDTAVGLSHMLHIDSKFIDDSHHQTLIIGPFGSEKDAKQLKQKVHDFGYPEATLEAYSK